MVDVSLILDYLQAVSIIAGVGIAIQQLRGIEQTNQRDLETREVQLQLNLLTQIRTMEFLKRYMHLVYDQEYDTYQEWIEKYGLTGEALENDLGFLPFPPSIRDVNQYQSMNLLHT